MLMPLLQRSEIDALPASSALRAHLKAKTAQWVLSVALEAYSQTLNVKFAPTDRSVKAQACSTLTWILPAISVTLASIAQLVLAQ